MDIGSLLGNILGTILKYKRDPYVHPYCFLGKANIDNKSYACRLSANKSKEDMATRVDHKGLSGTKPYTLGPDSLIL